MDWDDLKKLHGLIDDEIDSDHYDTEAMKADSAHGNFTLDEYNQGMAYKYKHTEIVQESMINGQWNQARKQCAEYELDFDRLKLDLMEGVKS